MSKRTVRPKPSKEQERVSWLYSRLEDLTRARQTRPVKLGRRIYFVDDGDEAKIVFYAFNDLRPSKIIRFPGRQRSTATREYWAKIDGLGVVAFRSWEDVIRFAALSAARYFA